MLADAVADARGNADFRAPLKRKALSSSAVRKRRSLSKQHGELPGKSHIMNSASDTASVMAASASARFLFEAAAAARAAASGAWNKPVQAGQGKQQKGFLCSEGNEHPC